MSASLQDQKLTELNFKVGVYKEKTQLDATSYWTDADKIRFRFGRPELMGGFGRELKPSKPRAHSTASSRGVGTSVLVRYRAANGLTWVRSMAVPDSASFPHDLRPSARSDLDGKTRPGRNPRRDDASHSNRQNPPRTGSRCA